MFKPLLSEYELNNLKRKLRTLKRRQELSNQRKNIIRLNSEIKRLHWEIKEAEAIRNNTYPRFEAEKTVYTFIDSIPDEILFKYLKENNLNVLRLIDEVEKNPEFINETFHMQWLPIIRVEKDIVYVQTIRGIEPVKKTSDSCNGATVGDYALCKSVRSNLFMVDYEEVAV